MYKTSRAVNIRFILIALLLIIGSSLFTFINQRQVKNVPYFRNVVEKLGIKQEYPPGGVAWRDYDGDGDLDLALFGGDRGVRIYENNAATFSDVTNETGLSSALLPGVMTGAFGDYNNDGCPDLFLSVQAISTDATSKLFRNNCNGTFRDVTTETGVGPRYHGTGIAWADYNNDGYLDLYVANYGKMLPERNGLRIWQFEPNVLFRNNRDGTFTNVTKEAGVEGVAGCSDPALTTYRGHEGHGAAFVTEGGPFKQSYQPIWLDYDNDGDQDLFIASDSNVDPLYRNEGDGTFTDVTEEAGLCRRGGGMGVTAGDYDADGDFDIYVTNTRGNYLWNNNGNGTFIERAVQLGIDDKNVVAWGTEFIDYDNDGDLDLYSVNGSSETYGFEFYLDPLNDNRDRLFQNEERGKLFIDVAPQVGIRGEDPKFAAAFADYDEDGFVDVFITSQMETPLPRFYRNQGNNNNWVTVRLQGTESNRDAIGARITVDTKESNQTREVRSGSSFLGQSSLEQTFGLGKMRIVDTVTINWPSGKKQVLQNIKVNRAITIREEK